MSIETRWPSQGFTDWVASGPDGEIALEYAPLVVGQLWLMCEHGTEVEVTVRELATMLRDVLAEMG